MNSKELFLKWIEDNYKRLIILANSFVGEEKGSDIINDLYLYFYDKKYINDNIIKNGKEFLYFYVSLKNMAFSKTSMFNKKNKDILPDELFEVNDNDLQNENNKEYVKILNILDKIYDVKIQDDWYNKKLFILYYYPEYQIDITNLSTKEVNNIRKTSLRDIQISTTISHSSIKYSIDKTLKKIKFYI